MAGTGLSPYIHSAQSLGELHGIGKLRLNGDVSCPVYVSIFSPNLHYLIEHFPILKRDTTHGEQQAKSQEEVHLLGEGRGGMYHDGGSLTLGAAFSKIQPRGIISRFPPQKAAQNP
jgi:hypothetical protein